MTQRQLNRYFERIGFNGHTTGPTLETPSVLQLLHSQTFPFENINPLLALPVNLDFESLYNKFVDNGRGGYCFEQNIFFMNILKMLGYKVRGLTGRVYNGDNMINRRAHMLLLIRIYGQNYISDVGFGSRAPSQPLLLEVDVEQATKYELFRINKNGEGYILQTMGKDSWRPLYLFDLQKQYDEDFEVGNWYTSTHPTSNFRHELMVSLKCGDKRYSLNNNIMTTYYIQDGMDRVELKSEAEIVEVLRNVFGINMDNISLNLDF